MKLDVKLLTQRFASSVLVISFVLSSGGAQWLHSSCMAGKTTPLKRNSIETN